MASSRRPRRGRRLLDDFALYASAFATQTPAAAEGGVRRATLQQRRKNALQTPLRLRNNNRVFYFSVSQRHDRFLTTDTKRRKVRADCVGDIGRGQVRVVLFGHPRIGMTELSRDHA